MRNKTQEVKQMVAAGKVIEALRIAKDFKMGFTKEQKTVLKRAYEMTWNPGFYEALGYNASEQLEKATEILEETYLAQS